MNKVITNNELLAIRTMLRIDTMVLRKDDYGVLCAWNCDNGKEISKHDIPRVASRNNAKINNFRKHLLNLIEYVTMGDLYDIYWSKAKPDTCSMAEPHLKKGLTREEFTHAFPDEDFDLTFNSRHIDPSFFDGLIGTKEANNQLSIVKGGKHD